MYVTPYFGHKGNVQELESSLPAVSLFLGPNSVGKWELAEHLRSLKGFLSGDVLRVRRLTQENARFIVKFASERPKGVARLVIAKIDKKASVGAQNTLLKTLEEASDVHFILIAEESPLPTIVSRSTVYRFGLLTEEDVFNILTVRKNFSQTKAENLSKVARGQIKNALAYTQEQDDKLMVLKALESLQKKNLTELESLASKWQQEHTNLLIDWCYECLTSRWVKFNPEETLIRGTAVPLRILTILKNDLRPRLVIRAGLASLLQ